MNPYKNPSRYCQWLSVLFFIATAQANAQTPEARCEKMLPLKTLTAAVGAGFIAQGATDSKSGEVGCTWWFVRNSNAVKTLVVSHTDKAGIADWGKNFSPTKSGDGWWEMSVKSAEDSLQVKGQLVPGIGKRAAIMPTQSAGSLKLIAQRADDVFEIDSKGQIGRTHV